VKRGELYRVFRPSGDPKKARVFVVVSRNTLIETRFSTVTCAPVYSKYDGLSFTFVRHRFRISSGKGREIDIMGAAGEEQWVCQSKWVQGDKISTGVLKELKAQADEIKKEKDPEIMRMWLFAHDGLSRPALEFAEKHGILWSSRRELDELLEHVGLRPLPDLS